ARQATGDAVARLRPEAVMHFAANALVAESMQNPSKYFRNNIANGLNLLDAMIAAEVRSLVFSSTCATFGPPERLPIDEETPQRPINPYGESKLAFEKILRWYDAIHGLEAPASASYNLGTGGGSSVREVIESCRKITGQPIPVMEKPRRPGDPPRLIASSEKIKRELGWRPQFQTLDAIVDSAWKWHQNFPRGY